MAAAEIRVVQDEKVTVRDVVSKVVPHRRPGHRQGANVDGNSLALGHQLAACVKDGGGEVPAGVEYLRHGSAKHDFGHLPGYRLQPVLYYRQRYGVGASAFPGCPSCNRA